MSKWSALGIFALLLLAGPAAAQNETVEDLGNATKQSPLDRVLDGVGGAVDGVGSAVDATGDGIADGASSVSKAFTAALAAIGSGFSSAARGVALAGIAVVTGMATLGGGLGTGLAVIGQGATSGITFAMTGTLDGIIWAAVGIAQGALAYTGLVSSMRPEAMPAAAFVAVTAVGATGSAGAGGWAGMQALKKWGMLGTGLAGIGGFSRINDDQLLEHPMRSQIFDTIKNHPGIHASQLAREMDVGWGTITHHLDKLQRAKIVTTRRVNNQKCFFEQGGNVSRQDMAIASALKGDTASGIAEFVMAHPMTSQKAMAQSLEISPALASFHVKKLVNLGVLEKIRHGKETLLVTSDGLRRIMAAEDPVAAAAMQKDDSGFEYIS